MGDEETRGNDELAGTVALVTGSARNIGRAIARGLAAGGAAVMVNANTSRDEAAETVALIGAAGGRAACYLADVTDPAAVARLIDETVERFGRLDALVNNAAIRAETPFESITYAEWRAVTAVTLDAAFLCSQAALPHLKEAGGGSIVNIGGMTGHSGQRRRPHVVASKAGVTGLTKALALDLAEYHITVNCVVPGLIETVRGLPGAPERPEVPTPPIGRRGEADEVAAMVRMLCGPNGRYITGQSIHVNGGALMP